MAESKVEIANGALIKIGAKQIQGFTDDTVEGRTVNLRYEPCRRAVLRMHPWNCALKRVKLSPLSTTPAFGYDQQFELPGDWLRIIQVNWQLDHDYRIENNRIHIDQEEVDLLYLYDLEDTAKMDALLSEAISAYLAYDIAYKITQRSEVRAEMFEIFRATMSRAATVDSQEDARRIIDASEWVDSRFGLIDDRSGK